MELKNSKSPYAAANLSPLPLCRDPRSRAPEAKVNSASVRG
jgi:hypothetical protein